MSASWYRPGSGPRLLTVAEDCGRRQILKYLENKIFSKYKHVHPSFKVINKIVSWSEDESNSTDDDSSESESTSTIWSSGDDDTNCSDCDTDDGMSELEPIQAIETLSIGDDQQSSQSPSAILPATVEISIQQQLEIDHAEPPAIAATCEAEECVVCLYNQKTHAFIPCGHKACCVDCVKNFKICPICRKQVKTFIRIYDV